MIHLIFWIGTILVLLGMYRQDQELKEWEKNPPTTTFTYMDIEAPDEGFDVVVMMWALVCIAYFGTMLFYLPWRFIHRKCHHHRNIQYYFTGKICLNQGGKP